LDLAAAGGRVAGLARGEYRLTVSAPGYLSVVTTVHSDDALGLPTTVWLAPKLESEALDLLALKAAECRDCSVLSGHVYDQLSGQPLVGARVRSGLGERAVTDADGYFEVRGKFAQDASKQEALPPTTSLDIEAPG
ncbi:hypothetical protein JTP67_36465, partial [Streptomyces sp. S12]|nr:hypothetical protein [Streptomyces sp. S12]